MSILANLTIGKRLMIIGIASLAALIATIVLAVGQLDSSLTKSFEARTKQTIDVGYSVLERFYAEEQAGRMTREQAQAAALEALRAMRFGPDNKDYYFVLDEDYIMVMNAAKKDLNGKNIYENKDGNGKFHNREMVDVVKKDGAGFVEYLYKLPDGSGFKTKISYIRGFKPWKWMVATGVLNEDVRAAVNSAKMSLTMLAVVLVGALLVLVLVISRSITGPLGAITGRMRTLADGDTHAEIPGAERRDEIGAMAGALAVFRDNALAKEQAEIAKAKADADQQAIVSLLSEKLEALSEGDLTGTITNDVPAAYQSLRDNFNTALGNLRELIRVLAESSHSIETGSHEISAASDDLARRTETNAASLEQTSAALSQMNERLKSSAEAADRTVGCAQEAMGIVDTGRSTATEATTAMDRVSESARGIDSVIEGLDKIAFQTRVLAMNAAVEAGRAGEAGRGFAVVADLVSALAMRSEEEAKRAREQLTATQTDVGMAVEAVKRVDSALATITDSVAQVHQFVETMANDNRAQSTTIGEIASAVGLMDHSTQQNAAMVEETSAAARNLAGEVATLARQSARFKVDAGGHRPSRPAPAPAAAAPVLPAAAPQVRVSAPALADSDGDWSSF